LTAKLVKAAPIARTMSSSMIVNPLRRFFMAPFPNETFPEGDRYQFHATSKPSFYWYFRAFQGKSEPVFAGKWKSFPRVVKCH
jgi:hypothetical protein